MTLEPGHPLALYTTMYLIRRFEEQAITLYQQGLVGGSLHPYIGQEAVAAGVCAALRNDDLMTMTYRGRGQFLAKGGDPRGMLAELLGRAGGVCQGKGGPMHLCDLSHGIIGANGIVAAGLPIAVGAGLAAHMAKSDRVAVAFFGDGATNQGAFHEALNLAAIWKLPVIFVCENNVYAEMTPIKATVAVQDLVERATGHGVPGVSVDGNDALAVYQATHAAVTQARSGGGPVFLECHTYRLLGHMVGDSEVYRTKEEVAEWRSRDPVQLLRAQLLANGTATAEAIATVETRIEELLQAAEQFARESPLLPAEALEHDVWAN
jgi:pyruvate dehydrogenase E1 component alpha subunit